MKRNKRVIPQRIIKVFQALAFDATDGIVCKDTDIQSCNGVVRSAIEKRLIDLMATAFELGSYDNK